MALKLFLKCENVGVKERFMHA